MSSSLKLARTISVLLLILFAMIPARFVAGAEAATSSEKPAVTSEQSPSTDAQDQAGQSVASPGTELWPVSCSGSQCCEGLEAGPDGDICVLVVEDANCVCIIKAMPGGGTICLVRGQCSIVYPT